VKAWHGSIEGVTVHKAGYFFAPLSGAFQQTPSTRGAAQKRVQNLMFWWI
jgi:hypothetical protein